jgi:hypothetical protein
LFDGENNVYTHFALARVFTCFSLLLIFSRSCIDGVFMAAPARTPHPPLLSLIVPHIPSQADLGTKEYQESVLRATDGIVAKLKYTNVPLPHFAKFLDVDPGDDDLERVVKGKHNENIIKDYLRSSGIGIKDVKEKVDMYQKIDFIAFGDFGRLTVQFKSRNINKRSDKNDIGVEYCKIYNKTGSRHYRGRKHQKHSLYSVIGRDRKSIADVYLCVDKKNLILHWMPNVGVERAAELLHRPYHVRIFQELVVYTNYHGTNVEPKWRMALIDKAGDKILQRSDKSLIIDDPLVGQIRYFRPHRKSEGIYKAVMYLNGHYTAQWELPLRRAPPPPKPGQPAELQGIVVLE